MTSKVINMVDRMKDAEDLALEALFASEPVEDNGFTEKVMKRVNRRLWLRRLLLPSAVVVGIAIAARPALDVLTVLSGLWGQTPMDDVTTGGLLNAASGWFPGTSAITLVAVTAVALLCLLPALEESA